VLLLPWLFALFGGVQPLTLRGVVRAHADRAPLAGVTWVEKGTANGTATDAQGRFVLTPARLPSW
jgi:hypothetical protein